MKEDTTFDKGLGGPGLESLGVSEERNVMGKEFLSRMEASLWISV